MSRADKIRKAAQRTAGEVREAAKRQRDNQRRERTRREFAVGEHRHCSVCWAPIPLDADPPVCSDEECAEKQRKRAVSYTHLTLPTILLV